MVTNDGWFWHPGEELKSADELFRMYLETVGRNANLVLNLPPDRSGSLPAATVERMEELGRMIDTYLGNDLALRALASASATRRAGAGRDYAAANLNGFLLGHGRQCDAGFGCAGMAGGGNGALRGFAGIHPPGAAGARLPGGDEPGRRGVDAAGRGRGMYDGGL